MQTLIILFVTIIGPFTASASAESIQRVENPYLYAVSKAGKTSFLLGSVHYGVRLNEFPEFVKDAIHANRIVIGERSIEDALENLELDYGRENQWPLEVRRALLDRGIPEQIIRYYDPRKMCTKYLMWHLVANGAYKDNSLDAQIQLVGRKSGMKFFALDTDQVLLKRAMNEANAYCTLQELRSLVEEIPPQAVPEVMEWSLEELAVSYRIGDEKELTDSEEYPSVYLRNRHWMSRLMNLHDEGYFAVVGMHHLAPDHPDGLISLFRSHGYEVTRINSVNFRRFFGN